MEKKIVVEINGRSVRIMPHMLTDAAKFGATQTKREIKETPKELIKPLPDMKLTPQEIKKPDLPITKPEEPVTVIIEKKTRKSPVKSKTK